MAKPKSIHDCKTGNDVRRLAEQQAAEREDVEIKFSGPHPVLKVHGRGAMPLPCNHGSKQLGKGLLCALRKQWKALGLLGILLGLQVQGYPIVQTVWYWLNYK